MSAGPSKTDARGDKLEGLVAALDGAAAGQRQDHHLGVAGVAAPRSCIVVQFDHLQRRFRSSLPTPE